MEWTQVALLLGAGLAAGFIAGLIGIGGGLIFAPVLFFYFQGIGVAPEVLTPLTLGSSLFCTVIAAAASAWFQNRRDAVAPSIAVQVGLVSALVIWLMTQLVTTQPWYNARLFQIVFSIVLLVVVARMVLPRRGHPEPVATGEAGPKHRGPVLGGTGAIAGVIAAASGVGGGVVLVPMYHNALHLPMRQAVGTSSATIVISSLIGAAGYAFSGLDAPVPATAIGYVDLGHALVLAVPSVLSARFGVWTAHRVNTRTLRLSFAVMAVIVAVRLLWRALG